MQPYAEAAGALKLTLGGQVVIAVELKERYRPFAMTGLHAFFTVTKYCA